MRRKRHISTIILILVFLVGLSVMLYPTISDLINVRRQRRVIIEYDKTISQMHEAQIAAMFAKAEDYNQKAAKLASPIENAETFGDYANILDVDGTGIIGYVTIDKIKTSLPIYHGTSDAVLNTAVGHIRGSSFPIGGPSTHSVISAHRGLPSAKLFTDLDEMDIGDTFLITVLDRVMKYAVDKISIVYPDDFSKLHIEKGQDYVTLITCTPYGVNTQRLLVRGRRVDLENKYSINVEADAFQVEPLLVAPLVAVPLLLMLLVIFTTGNYRRRRKRRKHLISAYKRYQNSKGGGDDENEK